MGFGARYATVSQLRVLLCHAQIGGQVSAACDDPELAICACNAFGSTPVCSMDKKNPPAMPATHVMQRTPLGFRVKGLRIIVASMSSVTDGGRTHGPPGFEGQRLRECGDGDTTFPRVVCKVRHPKFQRRCSSCKIGPSGSQAHSRDRG